MISIHSILVGTDFSPHSSLALQYAQTLAGVFNAEIILCHVAERADWLSQLPPGDEGYFPPNLPAMHEEQAQVECERQLAIQGISHGRVLVVHGKPYAELIRVAGEESVDMMIVGTHGRGAVAHMLLGSVAERIMRLSPCPVLTVHAGMHEFTTH